MIPLPGIRDKGGAPQLGAKGPHQRGPFGWPGEDDLDEDGGGLGDEPGGQTKAQLILGPAARRKALLGNCLS